MRGIPVILSAAKDLPAVGGRFFAVLRMTGVLRMTDARVR
jgi:hypothetical protein